MAVVVNEFEVLAPVAPQSSGQAAATTSGQAADKPEPKDLAPLLHELQVQELRAWAH